jgi:uncharacterized membrane protein YeaQ/YmgE (transglycosylase-associated protein family)
MNSVTTLTPAKVALPYSIVAPIAPESDNGLNIYSMIVAIVGSIVVLLIYNALMGRRRA